MIDRKLSQHQKMEKAVKGKDIEQVITADYDMQ